ncbi:MAG: MerR family transcriptional regulator [Rubrivivax sp.]
MILPPVPAPTDLADVRLRSGTVARLAGIPVATLRIWERRYQVVAAPKSAGGQRLYSTHDVQRLRQLRRLTVQGHAIGTIAMLPLAQLLALSDGTATGGAARTLQSNATRAPASVIAVGSGLAARLQAAGVAVARSFDDAAQAARALSADAAGSSRVVVVQMTTLLPAGTEQVLDLVHGVQAAVVIVSYAFGAASLVESLHRAGVQVHREPLATEDLVRAIAAASNLAGVHRGAGERPTVAPRRFSDDDLRRLGAIQTDVACECPRHVAELLLLLTGFERYSAECGADALSDADLHRELQQLTGAARALMEDALERVVATRAVPQRRPEMESRAEAVADQGPQQNVL